MFSLLKSANVINNSKRFFSTIPIKGVSRVIKLKVKDEADAIKAQEILQNLHSILKKDVKGFAGSTRFVCKSEWDMYVWARFVDLDSLKAYMASDLRTKKVLPLLDKLSKLDVGGKVHTQNFVADDW